MKYCFIGVGSIARKHINNIRKIDNESIIHAFRTGNSNYNDISCIVDKELFDFSLLDSFYDAIFITNPTSLHYDTLYQFKDKSNCFFIEKPIFSHYREDIFEEINDKITYIAAPLRFCAAVQYAKRLISEKGTPLSIRLISSSYLPEWRPGVDYRKTYSAHKSLGGGVNIDLIHELDYLVYLLGIPQKSIYINKKNSNLEIDSCDLSVSIHEYDNCVGEIHLDYFGRDKKRVCELYFNDNVIYIDIIHNEVCIKGADELSFKLEAKDMYLDEMKYFLSLIKNELKSMNDVFEANSVLKIINEGEI